MSVRTSQPPTVVSASMTSAWQLDSVSEPTRRLQGDIEVDIAVVGGGLAGLSAAHHLHQAEPGSSIALLEAVTVGSGSSGRSTGIVGPGVGGPITVLRRRHGDAISRSMFAESLDCVRRSIDLLKEQALDCELREGGQTVCALTPRQASSLAGQSFAFRDLGFDVPYLPAAELTAHVRSSRYYGGLRHPVAATLDPYRLCRAWGDQLRSAGVAIFEHTPVLRLDRGRPVVVHVPEGSVRAGRVVLATDSHTEVAPTLRSSIAPMIGHVLRTAPLDADQCDAVGLGQGDSVVDARNFFDYYRLTPDRRLVLGGARVDIPGAGNSGHAATRPRSGAQAWRRLHQELVSLFPGLAGVEVTDRWSGRMGATLDRLPIVGPVPGMPHVWYSGAWCGHGIALSIGSGARLAEQMTGRPPSGRSWLRDHVPSLPPQVVRVAALRAHVRGLDAADTLHRRVRRDATA